MSKRRSRKKNRKPNIPQSTLERARQQAAGDLPEDAGDPADDEPAAAPVAARESASEAVPEPAPPEPEAEDEAGDEEAGDEEPVVARAPRPSRRREARQITQAQIERSKAKGELDSETIIYALRHPTKAVTEDELHDDYGYVLRDLRNMGLLAAALMVLLVGMAQFI